VSALLFEAVRHSLELAHLTDGDFDPTVGVAMERRGFDRN
jgi:thiamine biosynthesis lipoprotein ApbE